MRTVALPTEHGGWSLTLEPALLGLIVAPSGAGFALAAAALGAFLVRTPLKVALVDRWRGRTLERTKLAWRVSAAEAVVLAVLLAVAAATAEAAFWWPLLAAAPLVALELWYDVRSRSRRLVPELAGTIGIGAVAAAVALAGGAGDSVAAGLWCVIAARAVASIPFVRLQLLRGKERPHRHLGSDLAQVAAVTGVAVAAVVDVVPVLAVVVMAVLALLQTWASRRPVPAVPVIGAQQVVLGLVVVVVTGLAVRAP